MALVVLELLCLLPCIQHIELAYGIGREELHLFRSRALIVQVRDKLVFHGPAGGVLQIVAFTELVIKRLRYTLRLFVFAVPYLAVLSAIAAGFGWLPAAQPGAWALFSLIFLAVLLTMTLGFELYYRISGKKYDGLLGQYRASRTRDENSRREY